MMTLTKRFSPTAHSGALAAFLNATAQLNITILTSEELPTSDAGINADSSEIDMALKKVWEIFKVIRRKYRQFITERHMQRFPKDRASQRADCCSVRH